jgi:hypothetical protein
VKRPTPGLKFESEMFHVTMSRVQMGGRGYVGIRELDISNFLRLNPDLFFWRQRATTTKGRPRALFFWEGFMAFFFNFFFNPQGISVPVGALSGSKIPKISGHVRNPQNWVPFIVKWA